VAAVGGGRGGGVARYLLGGWRGCGRFQGARKERRGEGREKGIEGVGERVFLLSKECLTGLVGREEMILSIDSRRSGYISARRTSRSVSGGG